MGNSNQSKLSDGINISGSIGINVLIKDDRKIILFSDDHANIQYCKDNKSINIADLLYNKINDSNIIIEEVPRKLGVKLFGLWESKHVEELKNLYLNNNNKITGIDIRPYLIDFSIDLISNNKEYCLVTLYFYLNKINNFFNRKNIYVDSDSIKEKINECINNINEKNTGICNHFKRLRTEFYNFYKELNEKNLLNKNLYFILSNYKYVLDKIEYFLDSIIEWYTILKIFSLKGTSFVHTGLYHSKNIYYQLKNFYNFTSLYNDGYVNEFPKYPISSCVFIPKKINEYIGNTIF